MISRWPRPLFYFAFALAIITDQLSKAWAMASLRALGSMPLIPGCLSLTYVKNTGIAFGLFAGQGLLVAGFIVVLAVIAFSFVRGVNWAGWEANLVGGCLCGGAIGNLVDRIRQGYVVDFFDAYLGPHHWPVFNVADSLICVCVGWIVVRQLVAK